MSIPCRLRQGIRPGLQSLGAGYNKSPQVPGFSFPSSYRGSTFLSTKPVFMVLPSLSINNQAEFLIKILLLTTKGGFIVTSLFTFLLISIQVNPLNEVVEDVAVYTNLILSSLFKFQLFEISSKQKIAVICDRAARVGEVANDNQ